MTLTWFEYTHIALDYSDYQVHRHSMSMLVMTKINQLYSELHGEIHPRWHNTLSFLADWAQCKSTVLSNEETSS